MISNMPSMTNNTQCPLHKCPS